MKYKRIACYPALQIVLLTYIFIDALAVHKDVFTGLPGKFLRAPHVLNTGIM